LCLRGLCRAALPQQSALNASQPDRPCLKRDGETLVPSSVVGAVATLRRPLSIAQSRWLTCLACHTAASADCHRMAAGCLHALNMCPCHKLCTLGLAQSIVKQR
jgi:hypothetical protein